MQLKSMLSKFFKQKIKTNDDTSNVSSTAKRRGFSLMDSMISFLIITIIIAAFAPVVIKKMTHGRGIVLKEGADTTKSCPHGCILCKADGTCLLCPLRCDSGFYKDTQGCQCVDCTETGDENCTGCKRNSEGVVCTKCKTGYYLDEETHICKECEEGYYCQNGITRTPCEKGTYQEERGQSACKLCDPGYYQDLEQQTSCKICNSGYFCAVDGMDHRDPCSPGSFSNSDGAKTACTNCYDPEHPDEGFGPNTYSEAGFATCPLCTTKPNVETCEKDGGAITKCQTGYYHNTSPDVCANCDAGYYMDGSHKCQKCTSGSTPENNTLSECSSCGTACVGECSPTSECSRCAAGYKLNASQKCEKCPAGTHSAEGATSCTPCSAGTYAANAGSTSCTPCEAGKYYSSTGATECTNCSAGTHSAAGAANCTPCEAGKYSNAGAANCTPCEPGKYSASAGSASCNTCSAGTSSSGGATSCDPCADGYYQDATGQGSCKPCANRVEHCEKCKKETGECEKCETGYAVNKTVAKPYVCTYRCAEHHGTVWVYANSINKCVSPTTPAPAGVDNVHYVDAAETCDSSSTKYCCWTATTVNTSGACSGAGCKGTICDWRAARAICANRTDGGKTASLLTVGDYADLIAHDEAFNVNMCAVRNSVTPTIRCTTTDEGLNRCRGASSNQCVPETYQAYTDSPSNYNMHVNVVGFIDMNVALNHYANSESYSINGARQFRCKRDPDYGEEIK